ncbi:hypothetical protein GW17_00060928 [Ensete ventricosum]|nr:hypothetical protein GW17_00060928 [Ensete ventricosum]
MGIAYLALFLVGWIRPWGSSLPVFGAWVGVGSISTVVFKGIFVPCCRVAPSELVAVGALLAVVLAEERPAIEMPTSALIGECAGRWFASSRLMPGHGG